MKNKSPWKFHYIFIGLHEPPFVAMMIYMLFRSLIMCSHFMFNYFYLFHVLSLNSLRPQFATTSISCLFFSSSVCNCLSSRFSWFLLLIESHTKSKTQCQSVVVHTTKFAKTASFVAFLQTWILQQSCKLLFLLFGKSTSRWINTIVQRCERSIMPIHKP